MKIHVWSLFSALKIQKMVTNLISLVPNTCKTCVHKYLEIDINLSYVPLIKLKIVSKFFLVAGLLPTFTRVGCLVGQNSYILSKIRYIAVSNIYKVEFFHPKNFLEIKKFATVYQQAKIYWEHQKLFIPHSYSMLFFLIY